MKKKVKFSFSFLIHGNQTTNTFYIHNSIYTKNEVMLTLKTLGNTLIHGCFYLWYAK